MIINISDDSHYHSQLNNKFFPYGTCNTTASINALKTTGIDFYYPEDMQPEDYLTSILESEEAWDLMKKNYPWALKKGYHPRHIHDLIAWAINIKLVGRDVDTFSTKTPVKEIFFNIIKHRAVNVTGRFTKSGHIVTVVGFETDQDDIMSVSEPDDIKTSLIKEVIIDDPYGNYHTGYKDHKGNDIIFSYSLFDYLTREYQSPLKWAHIFKK